MKSFLFCIGAQKAGTSWLWRYLSQHPEIYVGALKELHYFNSYSDRDRFRRLRAIKRERAKKVTIRQFFRSPVSTLRARASFGKYEQLFSEPYNPELYRKLKSGEAPWAKVTCDFTPAYAMLPEDRLREMAECVPNPLFLFVLREPVARIWSQIRMDAKRSGALNASSPPEYIKKVALNALEQNSEGILGRTDYASTLKTLQSAGLWDQSIVYFYEELFGPSADALRKDLLARLGVTQTPMRLPKRINKGQKLQLPPDVEKIVFERSKHQYTAVSDILGRQLPDEWQIRFDKFS